MEVALKQPDLKKEQRAAELIADRLLVALRDKDQFRRYIITEKRGSETYTEERVFDKLDLKAVGEMIRTLQALEELKRSLGDISGGGEPGDRSGLVILPMAAREDA